MASRRWRGAGSGRWRPSRRSAGAPRSSTSGAGAARRPILRTRLRRRRRLPPAEPGPEYRARPFPLSLIVIGLPKRSRLRPAATRIQPSDTQYSSTLVFSCPLKRMPTPRLSTSWSKNGLRGSSDRSVGQLLRLVGHGRAPTARRAGKVNAGPQLLDPARDD